MTWENTLETALAVEGLQSEVYTEKRSALRKSFSILLQHFTHYETPDAVQAEWDSGTWSNHIKLTRPSTSGVAANCGSPSALIALIVSAHVTMSPSDYDAHQRRCADKMWEALTSFENCAPATRGDGRTYGLHKDWDSASAYDDDVTYLDWCLEHAETMGITSDTKPAPKAKPEPKQSVSSAITDALDTLLESADLPNVAGIGDMQASVIALNSEVEDLRNTIATMPTTTTLAPVTVASDGAIPSGTVSMVPAHEAFGITGSDVGMFSMDVPVGEWDGEHPHVPVKDEDYVFDSETLVPVLLAITHGRIPWLKGHTGTGKTTLVEQVYARLQLPLFRLNLDSDITRGELVGREVLRTDGDGNTVTEFVDGIIPMAMQQPCGLLLDEIDASRPDLGFILQRLTEGKGFMLLEDGGRTIAPHPHFRMFATANTNGRGDETGLYSGTRALGTAFVNRFKPYIEVDYMSEDEEAQLIQEKVPSIDASDARSIASYATEHRVAFKQSDITLACSPRDTLAFALSVVEYKRCFGDKSDYVGLAFKHSIVNAADSDDRQVLDGLANRIFKSGE